MPPLSDVAIRRAKPDVKPVRLYDSGGLYLELAPNGSRYWRQKYRVDGREKRLAHGVYPDVSLAAAREKRDAARRLLAAGIDPGAERKAAHAARAESAASTFEVVAQEWLASRGWVDGYRVKVEGWFRNDVLPALGSRPVAELTARDFLEVLRVVEKRGAVASAHRILQNCSQVMRYAVASSRAERDPCADLRGALAPRPVNHFPAVTEPAQLAELLRAIDSFSGTPVVRAALRLSPLVFQRPGEVRTARWSQFDLPGALWSIPQGSMKMRRDHLVPLSRQAVAILQELHETTGRGTYVFPSLRTRDRPMSDMSVNAALRRLGYGQDTMTGHGFRATARTILDEVLGVRPDYIEHQLAHAVKDPNGRAYNRTTFLPERAAMMQTWADYLDRLRGGNVVPIRGAA